MRFHCEGCQLPVKADTEWLPGEKVDTLRLDGPERYVHLACARLKVTDTPSPDTVATLLTERAELRAQVERLRAWEGVAKQMVAALAGGPYSLGTWANELVHADPCDCDLDEENAGAECMAASDWRWAVLVDGGAFAPRPVVLLPRRPLPEPEADDWQPPELGELVAQVSLLTDQLAVCQRFLTLDGLEQYRRATDNLDGWRQLPDPEHVRQVVSTVVDGPQWRAPGW